MQIPLTLTFRHMRSSQAIENIVNRRVAKLEQFYDKISHCSVRIEAPRGHSRHDFPLEFQIEIAVPGKTIVAKSNSEIHHATVDAYATIRRTFDVAQRRLEDYARIQRHDVKRHTRDKGSQPLGSSFDDND